MHAQKWMALILSLALLLAPLNLALAAPIAAQVNESLTGQTDKPSRLARGEVPAGLSGEQWTGMQEQMRLAEYQFTWQVRYGEWAYRAPNSAQVLSLAFSQAGLKVDSFTASGELAWQFGLHLAAYGDQSLPAVIARSGLSAERAQVSYRWNASLMEMYTNTPQGIKHMLTLYAPPSSGELSLDFVLSGDLSLELDGLGGLILRNAGGAALLAYDNLAVVDATGSQLPARFTLVGGGLRIMIEATRAFYPVTVESWLQNQTGVLHASDAQAIDLFGRSVAVSGDVIVVGANLEDGGVGNPFIDAGAAYVYQRTQGGTDGWGEVQILRASDSQASDFFGYSVAVSGEVIVVGAYREDGGAGNPKTDAGAAYVFQRTQGGADNWGELKTLRASDAQASDRFGWSVAVTGDVIVVGATGEDGGAYDPKLSSGTAYVFQRTQGGVDNWGQVKILRASDAQAYDAFGSSVAISGDVIVIGAEFEDGGAGDPLLDAGVAYVFQRNRGGVENWGEVTIIRASDAQADDYFGVSVTVSGDAIVVGAPGEYGDVGETGAAYVFQRTQGGVDNWGEVTILRATDAQDSDYFGHSVAVSGDVIIVGAYYEDGGAGDPVLDSGAAYVFLRTQGGADNWGEVQILRASDAQAYDFFGFSVAVSGDVIVVGAIYEDGGPGDPLFDAGAAYVFQYQAHYWQETVINHASDAQVGDWLGYSLAVSGDIIVVGAPYEDGGPGDPLNWAGAAYVFQRTEGGADEWGEVKTLRASDAQADDQFGYSVAVSGDVIVIGAYCEDGGAGDPLFWAGAAYVFQRAQGGENAWGEEKILHASDAQIMDFFGASVAVSGDVIVVGANEEDGGAGNPISESGAAYVFQRTQGGADNWGEVTILHASDAQAADHFGWSVAVSGGVIAVGAYAEDGGAGDPVNDSGAAYVFQCTQGGPDEWDEVQILHASDAQVDDYFGRSVAVSSDVIVVGSLGEDGGPGDPLPEAGAAYIFQRTQGGADNWGETAIRRASDAQPGDWFGESVAVSGDVIAVGASGEDGGTGDPLAETGAAYVFQRALGGADSWGEAQILRASDAQIYDEFGYSVAVSGEVIVIGARFESGGAGDPIPGAGAAYVFQVGASSNHAPLLDPIGDQSGDEESLISFVAHASDDDPGDTLVFSLDTGAPDGAGIDPASGLFTWTPGETQGPGVYTVTVRVTDNGIPPMDDFETLHITVSEANQAPVLATIGDQSGDESTLITFTASATDTDIPTNTLTFSLDPGAPDGASIDPISDLFTWIPDEAQGPGVYTVTVRVTDDGIPPLDDFETLHITVSEVNLPPLAVNDAYTTNEDAALVVAAPGVLVNDSDPDIPANPLTALLDSSPVVGELSLETDGSLVYTPTLNFGGVVTFTYHAFDGQAASNIAVVTIEITPINDDPIVEAGEDQTTSEGQVVQFSGSYTDPGLPGSPVNILQPLISWDFGDGATVSGTLTPTHIYADDGIYTVTLVVSDELGGTGMDWLLVTVANIAPELDALPDLSGAVGEPLTVTGVFSDPGLLDTYLILIDWGDGVTETQMLAAGVYDFRAAHIYAVDGIFTVTVTVMDDDGGSDSQAFMVAVVQPIRRTFLPFLGKN
jgi:PKD domain/Bacterial Ig domain/FG-GAP repeat/Putative Ig domain